MNAVPWSSEYGSLPDSARARFEADLRSLGDRAGRAFDEGDAIGLLITMDNTRRLAFVLDHMAVLLCRGIYERCLLLAYTSTRSNHAGWDLSLLELMFQAADRAKLRAAGDPLPPGDTFTLYRGVAGKQPHRHVSGMSWTSDLERAIWFTNRRLDQLEDPAVYQATVKAEDIYCYCNGRQEHDFIVRTRRYRRVGDLRLGKAGGVAMSRFVGPSNQGTNRK